MKKLVFISIIVLLFTSCKKKVYHSFTDEERAYMVYEKGDKFKLKDENTGEIIEFTITDKYIRYDDDNESSSLSRKEHFMEQGEIKFSDASGNNSGFIYI